MVDKVYEQANNYKSVIRKMIEHENTLINQRIGWLGVSQGFLFTAVSFLWNINSMLVLIVGITSLLSIVSIGYSLCRGMRSIKDLLTMKSKFIDELNGIDKDILPPTIGSRTKAINILLPGYALPFIFGSCWIAIIIYTII